MQEKKKKHRWLVAAGTIVVVFAVAAGGFLVWHEQPGFCNAVCHQPMDNYVEGYYNDTSLLANEHKSADVACLSCHEATIDQQVAEGISWVRGDFTTDETGNLTTNAVTADAQMCTQSGCHDIDKVVSATENWGKEAGVNPHLSHQGTAIDCSNCHSVHEDSYMYCNTCHDYELPQGWQNPR